MQDEIRNALKPLSDLVYTVGMSYGTTEDETVPGTDLYSIILNTDDPDSYRDQIESLLHAAGLGYSPFEIKRNPEQGQGALKERTVVH